MSRKPSAFPYWIPILLTVAIHVALGGGLEAADRWAHDEKKKPRVTVEIVPIKREPPKEEPKEPPKEEPKPPELPQELPKIPIKVKKEPPPPKTLTPPEQQPKNPPPVPEEPPPLYTVAKSSTTTGQSSVSVPTSDTGNYKGSPDGVKDGKGKPKLNPVGTPTGTPGGTPGGKGTGPVAITMKTAPEKKTEIQADYPAEAERLGIEGSVKLSVTIDEKGNVVAVKVVKGLGYGLDQAAVGAMKRFKFSPAIGSDDKPMKVSIIYTYKWELP